MRSLYTCRSASAYILAHTVVCQHLHVQHLLVPLRVLLQMMSKS
jgi:hypothetical protein